MFASKPFAIALTLAALSAPLAGHAAAVISGGVADDGLMRMEQAQGNYSLKVTYAGNSGMFLSDVAVSIKDKAGNEVVNTTTQGPILLAELTPGTYTVTSSLQGITKTEKVTVGSRLKSITQRFPIGEEQYQQNSKVSYDQGYQDQSATRVQGVYSNPRRADELNAAGTADDSYRETTTTRYRTDGSPMQCDATGRCW